MRWILTALRQLYQFFWPIVVRPTRKSTLRRAIKLDQDHWLQVRVKRKRLNGKKNFI